jgi:RNA polymerase sigma-70 factor, ECF subfamily
MSSSARLENDAHTSASTSRSLLAALRGDEPAAWQRLVSLYAPLVYHWCRKMELADQDAADIFQEVFQSVARRIDTFHKDGPADTFRGWLRTITRNKVRDHLRRESRQPHAAGGTTAQLRLSELPDLDDDGQREASLLECGGAEGDGAGDGEDRASFQNLFRRALEQIAGHFEERTWQAFWRVVVEGKSAQEVAKELSMQPGTVRVAKSRVLHRLRKELGELPE